MPAQNRSFVSPAGLRERMEKMSARVITGFFANLGIVFFCLAVVVAGARVLIKRIGNRDGVLEEFYRWITLLPAGLIGIYTFILHAFFPEVAAASIGWKTSPFQYEVAMANLGFGLCCILAFKAGYGFRVATVVGITCWLWGDAVGHIRQMILAHDFSPGNAGSWFWTDVLVPLSLIILMGSMKKPRGEINQ